MKKSMIAAVAVLAIASAAQAATDTLISSIKPGHYNAVGASKIKPEYNGKQATATVATLNDKVTITFQEAGSKGKEVWTLDSKTLTQAEMDAAGKEIAKYSATATPQTAAAAPRTFAVNCADRAANKCDNNIPSNYSWTIKPTANGFVYSMNGPQDKANPASPIVERASFTFTPAK